MCIVHVDAVYQILVLFKTSVAAEKESLPVYYIIMTFPCLLNIGFVHQGWIQRGAEGACCMPPPPFDCKIMQIQHVLGLYY